MLLYKPDGEFVREITGGEDLEGGERVRLAKTVQLQ